MPELENGKASVKATPQGVTMVKYFRTNIMVFSHGENDIK